MAGVGLMHAGGDDGADVEGSHVLAGALGRPAFIRQRDVEVGLGGVRFKRARRVHGRLRGSTHERRCLFQHRLYVAGDGDDVVRADEGDLRVEAVVEGLQQLVGRRMHRCKLRELLLRRLGGIDLFGDAGELGLVLVEIIKTDLQQMVERDIDHFAIGEVLRVGVGTETEVAVGACEKIGLHPCAVALESFDDSSVGPGELGFGFRVVGIGEGTGDIVFKEAHIAIDLLQSDFGIDVRRILEVLASFEEDLRDLLFTLHRSTQAGVYGSVRTLHDGEDRARDPAGVVIRILFPATNHLKL